MSEPERALALAGTLEGNRQDTAIQNRYCANLTAGMGGDMVFGSSDAPLPLRADADMAGAAERVAHIRECRPEICALIAAQ